MKYFFILFALLFSKEVLQAQTCTVTIANPTPSICLNTSAIITASGATSYSWSTGATTASISVSPAVTTIYTVTGISGTCTQVVTTTVTIKTLPSVAIAPTTPTVCFGSAIILTGSGATTYTWSTGANTTTISVSPSNNTTYTLTGTGSNACVKSVTKTVTVNPNLVLTNATPSICIGSSAALVASGATTYSWSTGATTASISVSPTTAITYTVKGTSGSCSKTFSTTVYPAAIPNVTATSTSSSVCLGNSATLTASGATTYSWSTTATTTSIIVTPTVTTTYTVKGTTNGCAKTVSITITRIALPTVVISPTSPTICSGNAITLTSSGASTYTWNTSATTTTISVSPTINTTYTVTGTASTGCKKTAVKTVTVNNPIALVNLTQTICLGASATISATGSTTYSWSTGATTSSITVTPTVTTTYTVKGTTGSCVKVLSTTITVNPLPNVNISNPTPSVCLGGTAILTASGASTYSWSNAAITASTAVIPTVTTVYTVTGYSLGCSKTATATVNVGCPFNYNNIGYKAKWTNLYGTIFRRDSLLVSGVTLPSGYPTAITKNTLLENTNGWAEQIIGTPMCSNYAMGFCDSAAANNGDYFDIDFSIHVNSGALYVFYNGNFSYLGSVISGDVLRIERNSSTYYFKKNTVVLYSTAAPISKNLKLKGVLNVDAIVNIGCSFGDSTGINFQNFVQADAISYNSTATGINDGSIQLTPKFGNTGYTYSWTPSNETGSSIIDKNFGTYQVTIKDALQNASTYSYTIDYKVNWSVLENCSFINDSLALLSTLTGGGWGSAVSDNVLVRGTNSYVSWTIDNFTSDKVIGLLDTPSSDPGVFSDIDDGIYQTSSALYQKSQDVYSFISYCAIGDVIKMEKVGNDINYYRNNVLISTVETINTSVDLKIKAALMVGAPKIKIKTGFSSTSPAVAVYIDTDLNWHQEETFDENGNVIGTEKTYLDNLGRATQALVKNATNEVFTSQTVYDSYGRAAISTMPAFTGNTLAYQSWFMRTPNGQEYNYSHFDAPSTLNNSTLLSTSLYNTLGNYYSNTNPYDAYQAIADNPYTRVEYTSDPGGAQRRISKPGNAFKMGSGKENYSFSMISGDELKFVFGSGTSYKVSQKPTDKMDCVPLSTEIYEIPVGIIASKQIDISPDNVETISYSVGNKIIATCFSALSAGETCNNLVSVKNTMVYKGTKSIDVHLPNADKNSLYLPLPLQDPNNIATVTPANSIIMYMTDLQTDEQLYEGIDYTFAFNRNVIFNSVFLNKHLNKSVFLRISYEYTSAYQAYLAAYSSFPPADAAAIYNLSYGRFSKNYYDFGGALRKSVSPKGFACNTPTLITMATTYDYNHYGQLIAQKSPDEGLVEMTYDKQSKLRFSQNADQKINNRFSYVNYDKHARPYESGEYQSVNATASPWFTNYYLQGPPSTSVGVTSGSVIDLQDGMLDAQKTNTTLTSYLIPGGSNNIPSGYTYISQYQSFRNGQVNFVKNKNSTIWFNYDKVGRKTATITQITEADFVAKKPAINDQIKTSESSYNYFTGITNNATYQLNNTAEKLLYQYSYDANFKPTVTNLTYGSTSQNLNSYFYSKLGQLKRTVIGNNLQGMDFVYTLNGGLKAINHPGLDATLDPGADNGDYSGSNPALVNKDLFGEIIEFYNGDYQRNNTNINSSISIGNSKYNGLIYGLRFKTRAQVNSTNNGADYIDYAGPSQTQLITSTNYLNQELSFTYNYDEFNQLGKTTFNTYNNSTNLLSQRSEYAETGASGGNIAYDRNGNITRLVRQAYNSVVLDNLTNTIDATNNKLTAIVDAASNTYPQSFNFKTPSLSSTSPFVYNSIGQLTQSSAENISAITYMPDGKVKLITFTNGNTTAYEYGAGGEKLKSKFYNPTTNKTKYTWYVGPYIYEFDEATANTFNIAEAKVGGAIIRVNAASVSSGYLVYQVTDHLGNVRASFKSNGTGNGIDILTFNDYYAFGGQLPGRSYTSENYRFGYQGQEKGDASNPWYQFELRMFNQDIGRWFAPDPYGQFASPYIGMANNPVSSIDPDGGWVSLSKMNGQGKKSYDFQRSTNSGVYSYECMVKRYKDELHNLRQHLLIEKNDVEGFLKAIQALNAWYMGLGSASGSPMAGSLFNGIDYLTQSQISWHLDGVIATSQAAAVGNSNSVSDNFTNDAWSGQYEMVFTTKGSVVADHDMGISYYADMMQVGDKDSQANGQHDDWVVGYTKVMDFGNGNSVSDSWNVINTNSNASSANNVAAQSSGGVGNGTENQSGFDGWEHAAGPGLYALGQPINALKPVGALGSNAGSSIASKTLSKAIPQKFNKVLGKKVGTKFATTIGTNVIGRALGRFVPFVGWGLTTFDTWTFMLNNKDSFQQGMEGRDNYIQQGLMPLR